MKKIIDAEFEVIQGPAHRTDWRWFPFTVRVVLALAAVIATIAGLGGGESVSDQRPGAVTAQPGIALGEQRPLTR
jgi:hypothetical protein